MAHFAELDANNLVTRVLVVDNEDTAENGEEDEELGIKFLQNLFGAHGSKLLTMVISEKIMLGKVLLTTKAVTLLFQKKPIHLGC